MISSTWEVFAPLRRRFHSADGSDYSWSPQLDGGIDRFDANGEYVETITLAELRAVNGPLAKRMGAYYIDNITDALLGGARCSPATSA